jgi:hypothetical protein
MILVSVPLSHYEFKWTAQLLLSYAIVDLLNGYDTLEQNATIICIFSTEIPRIFQRLFTPCHLYLNGIVLHIPRHSLCFPYVSPFDSLGH